MARKEQEGMAAGDMDTNIEEGEHDHQFVQVGLLCAGKVQQWAASTTTTGLCNGVLHFAEAMG